jgi:hypothetical protein
MLNIVSNPLLNSDIELPQAEFDEKRVERIFELASKFKQSDQYIVGE